VTKKQTCLKVFTDKENIVFIFVNKFYIFKSGLQSC